METRGMVLEDRAAVLNSDDLEESDDLDNREEGLLDSPEPRRLV
jgi:hypothetical protein